MNVKLTKSITWSTLFLLLITIVSPFPLKIEEVHAAIQASYYVSPTGNDSNPGTLADPFLTIQKARDVVRTVNSSMTGDIMIYLRGGTYTLVDTFELTEEDSGTNGHHVIYSAYGNEVPVISGGQKVTGWSQVGTSDIWKASVSLERIRQFYVNDQRVQRARSAVTYRGTTWYDDPSPIVTKLGSGAGDYTIAPAAAVDLVFSETLSTAAKSAVESALTEEANQVITYGWNGGNDTLTITGHVSNTTTFAHDVVASVEDTNSQVSRYLLLVDASTNVLAPELTSGPLGDGTVDYEIPAAATVNLIFNEELSTAGKTAVETALTAGANRIITYGWNGGNDTLTITGHATRETIFVNDVRANVSDAAGNKAIALLLVDSVNDVDDKDGLYVNDDALGYYANATDMELHWSVEWKSFHHKVAGILNGGTGQKIINMQQPYFKLGRPGTTFSTVQYSSPFYIENALELLDTPGEWYFNRATDELFYWPKDGENMATADAYVPVIEQLVTIKGDSTTTKANNIQFYGITFEYGTWLRPDVEGVVFHQAGGVIDPNEEGWTLGHVFVEYAEDIRFERNTFRHMGSTALILYNAVHDSVVVGNVFQDISEGAISVGKYHRNYPLPVWDEVSTNNLISNNLIRDTGVEYWSSVAIIGYMTDTLEISHNDIRNNPYSGISVGWDWEGTLDISDYSRDNKILNNKVDTVMRITTDGGGIYTLGKQPHSIIDGNYVRNVMVHGKGAIYPDQGTSFYTISNNIVENITPDSRWMYIWNPLAHDLTIDDNYTTNSNVHNNGGANITITNTHYYPNANWPQDALDIIDDAGLEPAYQDLLDYDTASENLALFKTVDSSSSLENAVWSRSKVNDGWQAGITGSNFYTNGFSSAARPEQDSNEWIEIDLGANKTFNVVKLFPRTDEPAYGGGSANFPVDFTIQVKPNGGAYSTVKIVTDQRDPQGIPQGYFLGSQTARYVKIDVSRLGTPVHFETTNFRLQLAEIEVFNDSAVNSSSAFTGTFIPVSIPAPRLQDNIAFGKAGTVSSVAPRNFADNLVDGIKSNIWVSDNSVSTNHTESIVLDLGKRYAVSKVDLYPRNDEGNVGQGFPVNFTIQTSTDGTTWGTAVSKTGYALPGDSVQSFSFIPVNARYVKIEGTSLRQNPADGNLYRMAFAEVEVYGNNRGLGETVAVSSTEAGGTGWYKDGLVDGFRRSSAWSSNSNLSIDHTEWAKVDLGDSYSISIVDLYPRVDTGNVGQGFPIDFTIQTSTDDVNWTTVVTETGYAQPGNEVQSFSFSMQMARYIKVEGTKLRPNPADNNFYRMQLVEMEAYGGSKALNKKVTASSSVDIFGWFTDSAVDGLRSTSGWSSNDSLGTDHTEWITVDLGASESISQVDLYPRNDAGNVGQGFPIDFTIEVSADNTNWTPVITRTSYALPGNAVQSFTFSTQNARYVKINGTSLRQNPADNNFYRMQINDIEIY